MLNRLFRRIKRFFRKSSTLNDEPINRVSLGVIILIDIFILVNVFIGLDDIGRWYISPNQAYGCYPEWQSYRESDADRKDFTILQDAMPPPESMIESQQARYQRLNADHLGSVSSICTRYAEMQDDLNRSENQAMLRRIEQLQDEINDLEVANQTIRNEYDSSLLEDIAGQPREQAITSVEAAQASEELEANDRQITTLKAEQDTLRNQLITTDEGDRFLQYLNDTSTFQTLESRYDRASFWYPSIQIIFQGIFLVPLLVIAWIIHRYGRDRGYGLVALLSWHLIVIFCIPLVVKVYEFLQVGFLFTFLAEAIGALLGGLLFLISYLYILIIPVVGFGIIKFFQRVVFNTKLQAASRVQKSRCIRCAKKIHRHDTHCPHCGYHQFTQCRHGQHLTYKHLPHCRECGRPQASATNGVRRE